MKKHSIIRKLALVGAFVGIAAFAVGCGQTAPTGVDVQQLESGQDLSQQGGNVADWEQVPR